MDSPMLCVVTRNEAAEQKNQEGSRYKAKRKKKQLTKLVTNGYESSFNRLVQSDGILSRKHSV